MRNGNEIIVKKWPVSLTQLYFAQNFFKICWLVWQTLSLNSFNWASCSVKHSECCTFLRQISQFNYWPYETFAYTLFYWDTWILFSHVFNWYLQGPRSGRKFCLPARLHTSETLAEELLVMFWWMSSVLSAENWLLCKVCLLLLNHTKMNLSFPVLFHFTQGKSRIYTTHTRQ